MSGKVTKDNKTPANSACLSANSKNGWHAPGTREVSQGKGTKPMKITFCKNCGYDLV